MINEGNETKEINDHRRIYDYTTCIKWWMFWVL